VKVRGPPGEVSILPILAGLAFLGWGLWRLRLSYENERYFDARTSTVYHLQAAEVFVFLGAILIVAGTALASVAYRRG